MVDPTESTANGASITRLQAIELFAARMRERVRVGHVAWSEATPNLRALAVNSCLRRQQDSLEGAVALGKAGHGHLAVTLVRAFLEERLWIGFIGRMTGSEANSLLLALGQWDVVRTLVAQRDYIGDRVMTLDLWYPPGFVDAQAAALPRIKEDLRQLRNQWGWQGTLPSTAWIADQVSLTDEYEYLHSATSRAVHFSAGEVLRRGWGTPGGVLITDKAEFREHLAEFAYDQLWRQHVGTLLEAADLVNEAAISTAEDFFSDDHQDELSAELQKLGRVPLVHAHEWNLEPPPLGTRMAWAMLLLADNVDGPADS